MEDIQALHEAGIWTLLNPPWLYLQCSTVQERHWTVSIRWHYDWKGHLNHFMESVRSWCLGWLYVCIWNDTTLIQLCKLMAFHNHFSGDWCFQGRHFSDNLKPSERCFHLLPKWTEELCCCCICQFLLTNSREIQRQQTFWWNCDRHHW